MRIEDLLGNSGAISTKDVQTIRLNCTQFLCESAGLPLYKSLPASYSSFHKVKVRMKKRNDDVGAAFNEAFRSEYINLTQRAVFAYPSCPPLAEGLEPFYVFPIDGYKFLYSKEVTNSSNDYRHVVDTLFNEFEDTAKAGEIVTDLLKYTYASEHLTEAIMSESEIIFYGIPYYFAVRASEVTNYSRLLTTAQ